MFGERERSQTRKALCDRCWEAEKAARGYDPETYAGAWFELLASDRLFEKRVFPVNLPKESGGGKKETASNVLGTLAAHYIGIGWKSVHATSGMILVKDYPVEMIRVDDGKETYEQDDIYTAKLFFYALLPSQLNTVVPSGVTLGRIKAKWKGIVSKSFAGVFASISPEGAPLSHALQTILNDKDVVNDLSFLFRDVVAFGVRWMGPDVDDDYDNSKLRLIIRDVGEKKYLEIETRTVRFSGVSGEAKEYYQNAFRTLLCSVAKIAESVKASLCSSPRN
jgi:hypothetical protein